MQLEALRVLNLPKKATISAEGFLAGAFRLDSCQRKLWVCAEADLRGLAIPEGIEVRSATDAYLFLLRVATGLESQILGETDIFGQLKSAWQNYMKSGESKKTAELVPWFQRLFEDTKEIRSRYLQNQGGDSYGTLVRKMLRDLEAQGPVLLLGAGALAHSVSPFFLEEELWVENRNAQRSAELVEELLRFPNAGVKSIETPENRESAWNRAGALIVCIPYDTATDSERVARWANGGAERPVIHLGDGKAAGAWAELPAFRCLEDLFALQKAQGELRSTKTQRAFKACEERAKLRALGNSVSIPHGWEDLAVFA